MNDTNATQIDGGGVDLKWIREQWDGTLTVKGIQNLEDAKKAADLGADAILPTQKTLKHLMYLYKFKMLSKTQVRDKAR